MRLNYVEHDLTGKKLAHKCLRGADFSRALAVHTDFRWANLSDAKFIHTNCAGANMNGANLAGAKVDRAYFGEVNFHGADLTGVDLRTARLAEASFSGAHLAGSIDAYAEVSFDAHGQCGRRLLAVVHHADKSVKLYCGCFMGTAAELKAYIKDDFDANRNEKLRDTRLYAMRTVLKLLAYSRKAKHK